MNKGKLMTLHTISRSLGNPEKFSSSSLYFFILAESIEQNCPQKPPNNPTIRPCPQTVDPDWICHSWNQLTHTNRYFCRPRQWVFVCVVKTCIANVVATASRPMPRQNHPLWTRPPQPTSCCVMLSTSGMILEAKNEENNDGEERENVNSNSTWSTSEKLRVTFRRNRDWTVQRETSKRLSVFRWSLLTVMINQIAKIT